MMNVATPEQKAARFEMIRQADLNNKRQAIVSDIKNIVVGLSPDALKRLSTEINNEVAIRNVMQEFGAISRIANHLLHQPMTSNEMGLEMIAAERNLRELSQPGSGERGRYAEHPLWKQAEELYQELLATLQV